MPQAKPITIKKLRDRLAEQDETIRKLAVLADALLLANPSLAKAWGREETLARMLEIYDQEVAKANTAGGAIARALDSPSALSAGYSIREEADGGVSKSVVQEVVGGYGAHIDVVKEMFKGGDPRAERERRIEKNREELADRDDPLIKAARERRLRKERA
jgi:hypothetical protein